MGKEKPQVKGEEVQTWKEKLEEIAEMVDFSELVIEKDVPTSV